jgi:hypothetical protein
MARTRRAQILMEPEEYARLENLAARQGKSVGELIRQAVARTYFARGANHAHVLQELFDLEIEAEDWSNLGEEMEEAHDVDLS